MARTRHVIGLSSAALVMTVGLALAGALPAMAKVLMAEPHLEVDGRGQVHATWSRFPQPFGTAVLGTTGTGWRPERMGRFTSYAPPAVAYGPGGRGLMIWSAWNGSVRVAELPYAGSPPTVLGRLGGGAVAIGPGGRPLAVWFDSGARRLLAAVAERPSGPWSRPATVARTGRAYVDSLRVVTNRRGDTTALWLELEPGAAEPLGYVRAASRSRARGQWDAPVPLSARGSITGLDVAAGPDGAVTAIWARDQQVEVRDRAGTGTWSPVRALSDVIATSPDVSSAPDGRVVAAWAYVGAGGSRVMVAERPSGGDWRSATALPAVGSGACTAAIAAGSGRDVVLWTAASTGGDECIGSPFGEGMPATRTLVAMSRRSGGWLRMWSAPAVLDRGVGPMDLVRNRSGRAVAAWASTPDPGRPDEWEVFAATSADGFTWEPPTVLDLGPHR